MAGCNLFIRIIFDLSCLTLYEFEERRVFVKKKNLSNKAKCALRFFSLIKMNSLNLVLNSIVKIKRMQTFSLTPNGKYKM